VDLTLGEHRVNEAGEEADRLIGDMNEKIALWNEL
jgi:hypothetical protein